MSDGDLEAPDAIARERGKEFAMSTTTKVRISAVRWVLAVGLLLGLTASARAAEEPSAYHRWIMRGSVIESGAEGTYLCIGTSEGAKVGEELAVVRIERAAGAGNPKTPPRFRRTTVGRVRIDEIVDVHYARATVLEGQVEKGDVVELESK